MTIAEMIQKYNIRIASGGRIGVYNADRAKRDKMLDEIFAVKPEIIAYLNAEKEAREKAAAERMAKIKLLKVSKRFRLRSKSMRTITIDSTV